MTSVVCAPAGGVGVGAGVVSVEDGHVPVFFGGSEGAFGGGVACRCADVACLEVVAVLGVCSTFDVGGGEVIACTHLPDLGDSLVADSFCGHKLDRYDIDVVFDGHRRFRVRSEHGGYAKAYSDSAILNLEQSLNKGFSAGQPADIFNVTHK